MGLVPTKNSVDQSLIDATDLIKETYNLGALNAAGHNVEALRAALKANATWEGGERLSQAALAFRINFGRFVQQRIRTLYNPILDAYARIYKSRGRNQNQVAEDVYQLFVDEGDTINSRDITVDTSLTKTGTGDPTVRRLTLDKWGNTLENMWIDEIQIVARQTQPNTRVGQEILEISMGNGFDIFSPDVTGEVGAGGEKTNYTLQNSDTNFVSDASFESPGQAVAEGVLTASDLGSWEIISGLANLSVLEGSAVGYRDSVTERDGGNQYALRATADFEIRQAITRGLLDNRAYDRGCWANPNAALVADATATIDITLGSQTTNVNTNTLTAGIYQLVAATLDENLYGENCKTDQPFFKIAGSNFPGSPSIDLDATFVREMVRFNGLPWHIIPGATPVGTDYEASLTDVLAGSDALIALFLFIGYGFEVKLPTQTGGTENISDP